MLSLFFLHLFILSVVGFKQLLVNYRVPSLFIKKTISRICRIAMYEITNPKTKHMKRTWIRTKRNKKNRYVYLYAKIPPHKLLNKGTKYKIIKRKKMVKQRKEIATMGNQVWFAIVVGFFTSVYRSLSFFCVFTKIVSIAVFFISRLMFVLFYCLWAQMQCKMCAFCGFSIYYAAHPFAMDYCFQ